MSIGRTITVPLALAVGLLTLGCTCASEKPAPKPKQVQAKESEPALPPRVDEALLAELREAATACSEGPRHLTCTGGKKNALLLAFNRGDKQRTAALPTISYAFSLGDEKLSALSAAVLYGAFRLGLDSKNEDAKPQDVDPEDARDLLTRVLALPPQPAMQAIPAAVHSMLITGQAKELKAALGPDVPALVRTMALRYMMVYGRLEVFDQVKAAGLDPGAAVVLAAVESPRNMKNWKAEERDVICPWLSAFLEDPRGPVVGNALAGLTNCGPKELDLVLGRVEASLRDRQFSFIHSTALRSLCGKGQQTTGSQATEAQCRKVRALQEKAAAARDLEPRVRAMTLANVAYDWPDKESLALAKKLEADPANEVQRAAKQIVSRLDAQLDP